MSPESPVTLITAAGRGMGAAIARELAGRGHRLVLMSPSGSAAALATELAAAGSTEAVGLTGSVTDEADLDALVAAAVDRWGRVDGVVANTGHPPKGDLLDVADDAWHSALDLVLLNVVRLARRVVPLMERQGGGGAFVNISAFGAYEPSLAFPVSSTLRAALGAFARLFASRYGEAGIRMNNVLPGFIDSYPETPELVANIPMGRFGKVEEIAKTVAFLLSPDAGYLTGDSLRLDGGMSRSV